ncbi:MAG: hypothetical protein NDI94_07180, partial [Candidatus Woesearchaeota archaeon]|nr:hypothetical protein [Candidatus Woesearchaeota archaeon]
EVRGGIYYHFLPFAKDEPSPYTEIRVSPQYFKKASSHFGFSSGQIDMMSGIFSGTFIEDYTQRISMPEMKLRLIDLLAVC